MFRFFGMLVGALNLLLKSVSYLKSSFEGYKKSVPSALSYSYTRLLLPQMAHKEKYERRGYAYVGASILTIRSP